ncbi:hypothetical protein Baya_13424 [Bagarius yarrelli]|uniref:Secreted protein n=1 Tax=Bagarius yarrelli TaxID=175774 RepID=A0A556V5J3_BAGYA|nr:hypothetical protein Baya_13424 [Bagarius yarrelli]
MTSRRPRRWQLAHKLIPPLLLMTASCYENETHTPTQTSTQNKLPDVGTAVSARTASASTASPLFQTWELAECSDEQLLSRRAFRGPQMFPYFTGEYRVKRRTTDCFPSHMEVFHLKRQVGFSAVVESTTSEPR